jgi:hypothetical protein
MNKRGSSSKESAQIDSSNKKNFIGKKLEFDDES